LKNKIYFLGLFAALCFTLSSFNYKNEDPIAKIISQLNKWRNNSPQEKVHLHLDKSIYTIGEDIWLKAYIVNGEKHQLSAISATLNIELINDADSIKQYIKLPIAFGMSASGLLLPSQLKTGNYRIRAYTNYMRNSDVGYFFEKTLTIINPENVNINIKKRAVLSNKIPADNPKNLTARDIDFQLFPEGGYLINGLSSKLAFKANDKNGLGVNIKGIIRDRENKDIVQFASTHQGMGQILFTPLKGQTYKAVVILANGSEITRALPIALEQGIKMSLNEIHRDTIAINISSTALLNTTLPKEIYVVGQQGGKVYYAAKTLVNDTSFIATVAKNTFPTGVVQFTLFSSDGLPVSERMVFVQNNDALTISTVTDKQIYNSREKVTVALSVADQQGTPVSGNFSVAVIEEKRIVNEDGETSILSNLLLSSDLKGLIEKPNSYFRNNTDQNRANLDLLMLTHGYSKFEWKKVLDNNEVAINPVPEKALQVSGYLKTLNNKPLKNSLVTLFTKGNNILFLDTLSDRNGKFTFDNLTFEDSTAFVVQALDGKNKNKAKIELIKETIPTILKNNVANTLALVIDTSVLEHLKYDISAGEKAIMLREIELKTAKKVLKYSDNLNGVGKADQIVIAEELKICIDLAQCLQTKLSGIIFQDGVPYSMRSLDKPMRIVLDGLLKDGNFRLKEIPIETVESVEVLKSMALSSAYGADGGAGMIIITSKRGKMQPETIQYPSAPDVVSFSAKGYQVSRIFYSPQYDIPKQDQEATDFRSTVFWSPNIFTEKGKAKFDFFTNDSKGIFKMVIEGIADDGTLARHTYRYEVK
jgi:hypothetical protein